VTNPGFPCDPRCKDGAFNVQHIGDLCSGCPDLPKGSVTGPLFGSGGCDGCQTLCPGAGPFHFCLDKVFAGLGIALAAGILLFGVYLVFRAAGNNPLRRVGTVFAPVANLLRSSSGAATGGGRRVTHSGSETITQRARRNRTAESRARTAEARAVTEEGMNDTVAQVLANTQSRGEGTGPKYIEGVGK
jgi:hypothetical protein